MPGGYDDDPYSYENLIRETIDRAADKWGVDRAIAHGLTFQESKYNPNAVGPMTRYGWKAKGLGQLSPDVAKQYGVKNIHDPEENANASMGYLRSMIDKYGPEMGVAAYNMGPGNADKVKAGHMPMPAETKKYVPLVQQYANQYRKGQPLGPRKLTKTSLQTAANRTVPAVLPQPGDAEEPDTTEPQEPEPTNAELMFGGAPTKLPVPEYNEKTDPYSMYTLSREQADEQTRQEAGERHKLQAAQSIRHPQAPQARSIMEQQQPTTTGSPFDWRQPSAGDKALEQMGADAAATHQFIPKTGKALQAAKKTAKKLTPEDYADIQKSMDLARAGDEAANAQTVRQFNEEEAVKKLDPRARFAMNFGIGGSQEALSFANALRNIAPDSVKEMPVMKKLDQADEYLQHQASLYDNWGDKAVQTATGLGISWPLYGSKLSAALTTLAKSHPKTDPLGSAVETGAAILLPGAIQRMLGVAEPGLARLPAGVIQNVVRRAAPAVATGTAFGGQHVGMNVLRGEDPTKGLGEAFGMGLAMGSGHSAEAPRPEPRPELRTVERPTGAQPNTPAQPTPFGAGEIYPIRREAPAAPPPAGYGEGEIIPIARKVAQAAPDALPNPAEPRKTRTDTGIDVPGERVAAPLGETKIAAQRNSMIEGLRNRNQELQAKIKDPGTPVADSTVYRTELARNIRQIEAIQAAPPPEPLATPGSPGETEAQAPGTPRGAVDQSGKPIVRQGGNVQSVPAPTPLAPDQEIQEIRAKIKPAMQFLSQNIRGRLTPELEAAQRTVETGQERIRQLEAQRDGRGQQPGVQQIPPPQRQPQLAVGDQLRAALVGDTQPQPGAGESGEVIPIRRPEQLPPPAPPAPPAPEPPLLPEGEGGAIAPIRRPQQAPPLETPPGRMPTTPAQPGEGEIVPIRRPGQPPPGYGEGEVIPIRRQAPGEAAPAPAEAPAEPAPAPVEAAPAPAPPREEPKSVLPEPPKEELPLPEEEAPRGTEAGPELTPEARREQRLKEDAEFEAGNRQKLRDRMAASEEEISKAPTSKAEERIQGLQRAEEAPEGPDKAEQEYDLLPEKEKVRGEHGKLAQGFFKASEPGGKDAVYNDPGFREALGVEPNASMGTVHKALARAIGEMRGVDPDTVSMSSVHPGEVIKWINKNARHLRDTPTWDKIGRTIGYYKNERIGAKPAPIAPAPTEPTGPMPQISDKVAGNTFNQIRAAEEAGTLTPAHIAEGKRQLQNYRKIAAQRGLDANAELERIGGVPEALEPKPTLPGKVTLGEGVKVEAPADAKPTQIEKELGAHRVSDKNVEQISANIAQTVKNRPAEADRQRGKPLETERETIESGGTAAMPSDRLLPGAEQIPSAESEGGEPLSPKAKEIETRFRNYLATHTEEAVQRYFKLFGKEINTDNVRELSHEYANFEGRQLYSPAVHEPSSWLAKKLLSEIVKLKPEEGQENLALATAGGSGAGKSSLLRKLGLGDLLDKSQFIFDSNLHNSKKAIQKIDQMLTGGRKVVIEAVYRDPIGSEERPGALEGVLHRALNPDYGRMVSIKTIAETHSGMIDSLRELAEHYKDNPNVQFKYIDNSRGHHNAIEVDNLLDAFKPIDHNELERQLHERIEELYRADKIPESVYRIAKGEPPEGPGGGEALGAGAKGGVELGVVSGSKGKEPEGRRGPGAQPTGEGAGSQLQRSDETLGVNGGGQPEPNQPQKAVLTNPTAEDIPKDIKLGPETTRETEQGTRVKGHYAVVEGNRLKSSFDYHTMENVADFPQELQGRQKERAAADAQVRTMAAGLKAHFLGEAPHVTMGAPTAAPNLELEVGRTRYGAIQLALENNGPRGKAYREGLASNAEAYGATPEEIRGMEKPTLVFIRTTPVDRVKFSKEGDEAATTTKTPIEQAHADVQNLNAGLMDQFVTNDEGNLNLDANLDFIRGFIGKLPESERGSLLTGKGKLNQVGLTRVRNAVFNKAYGHVPEGEQLLEKLAEATDDTTKTLTNAMVMRAPAFARLRDLVEKGARHDLDVSGDLAVAANTISDLRERGLTLERSKQITAQRGPGMFEGTKELTPFQEQLVNLLEENKRSAGAINDIFTLFTDGVEKLGNPQQSNLLGERKIVPTREGLVQASKEIVDADREAARVKAAERAAKKAGAARGPVDEGGTPEGSPGAQAVSPTPPDTTPSGTPRGAISGEGTAKGPGVEKEVSPTEAEGVGNVDEKNITYRHGGIGLSGIPIKSLRQVQDAMRTVETLIHWTAPGKQGLWYSVTKPQHLAETMGNMFKSFKDSNYEDAMKGLMTTREAAIGRQAGLWNAGEGDMARKIYGLKAALKAHGEDMADVNAIMKGQFGTKEPNVLDWQQKADAVDMLSRWAKDVGAKQPHETAEQYKERITQSEEAFQSPALEKVPILGAWARKSKNTYNAFLDTQRQLVFRDYVKQLEKSGKTFESDPKVYKDLATLINSHTGRGDLGEYLNKHSDLLGTALFSPRYIKSRLDFFNPRHYVGVGKGALAPEVRRANIKETVQFLSTVGGMMALAKMGGADIGMDPTKNDFAKLKWGGRTTSVLGGYEDYFRFFAQTARALYRQQEGTLGRNESTAADIVGRFARGKSAPGVSLAYDIASGTDFRHQPTNIKKAIAERFTPFFLNDLKEAISGGQSPGQIAAGAALGLFGSRSYPTDSRPGKLADVDESTPLGKEQIRHKIAEPLTTIDIKGDEREPSNVFKARRDRVSGWWQEYGTKLVESDGYKKLTPMLQERALNSLRDRLSEQGRLKVPNLARLNPDTLIGAAFRAEHSAGRGQERRERTREWTPTLEQP